MVEGLIRALGNKLDERAHQKFAELGLPLKGKLQPAYPRDAWISASLYAGELLNPTATPIEQRRLLGHRFVDGYAETLVGKALLASMRVLGTRRALARLEKSFRTGNNYSKAELREQADGLFMVVSNAPYPEWYQGMIESACRMTGAKEYRVQPIKREGDTTTFRIEFR
jgi:uncharacterized protein (TIGR02265 family)